MTKRQAAELADERGMHKLAAWRGRNAEKSARLQGLGPRVTK